MTGIAKIAARLLAERRARDEIFGPAREGFGEPVWDILLAVAARHSTDEHLTLEQLIAASNTASAVTQRYLAWMVSRSLLDRAGDGFKLSSRGRGMMMAYLEQVA